MQFWRWIHTPSVHHWFPCSSQQKIDELAPRTRGGSHSLTRQPALFIPMATRGHAAKRKAGPEILTVGLGPRDRCVGARRCGAIEFVSTPPPPRSVAIEPDVPDRGCEPTATGPAALPAERRGGDNIVDSPAPRAAGAAGGCPVGADRGVALARAYDRRIGAEGVGSSRSPAGTRRSGRRFQIVPGRTSHRSANRPGFAARKDNSRVGSGSP